LTPGPIEIENRYQKRAADVIEIPPSNKGAAPCRARQYDELMRRAGAVWDPGARQWLIERRRIGPVIRELEHVVDPLFAQAGIRLLG
jgi:hypothetical protein